MDNNRIHTSRPTFEFLYKALAFLLAAALLLPFSPHARAGQVRVYLTSGTSWSVPSDWNSSNNTIEVIGGGGNGGQYGGGGGGAYSKATNVTLTPSASVAYAVGSAGGDTYFCNSSSNCASIAGSAVVAGAKGGATGDNVGSNTAAGGAAASGVGSTKYFGGTGSGYWFENSFAQGPGSGGGAAGPSGNGGDGTIGTGGAGDAGAGGAGGFGANGVNGSEWDESHGSGGGGAGIYPGFAGGSGGLYGAGGGGGTPVGAGAPGLIVITYQSTTGGLPGASPGFTVTTNTHALSNFDVRGSVSKGSGTFIIDHPQAPGTKLLYHSFVESPDVKNLYDGIATLDGNGEATIELPSYFEALNKDFRYQFFPTGEAMPDLYLKSGVYQNKFTIAGGIPGGTISWQVTGIRHDPYIQANPVRVEVEKGSNELVNKGECIFEPLCQ